MPLSAVDSIDPAFEHAKRQLFRPFKLGQWTKLAFVGLFAGELSSGGGGNFNVPSPPSGGHGSIPGFLHLNMAVLIPIIIAVSILFFFFWFLFLYVSSRMRFVLFDSVLNGHCSIRQMWRARSEPAFRFFVWQIVFSLAGFVGTVILLGIPALIALSLGWFSPPGAHVTQLVLAGIAVFIVFMVYVVAVACVHVFSKDFVVPQMALENISAFEGWRRLLQMIKMEMGGYAAYAGMKLVLAIGAAFAVTFAAVIVFLVLLIPIGGVGIAAVLLGASAGLSWNVFTVTAAIVIGVAVVLVIFYVISLISVPAIVFFPAYSIYFFASRYPLLASVLYPAPPAPPLAPAPQPAV